MGESVQRPIKKVLHGFPRQPEDHILHHLVPQFVSEDLGENVFSGREPQRVGGSRTGQSVLNPIKGFYTDCPVN